MNEPEYEVHPLDRDYSDAASAQVAKPTQYDPKIRRTGFIVFLAGWVLIFVAAILLSNFRISSVETLGSLMHRGGMFTVLIGGLVMVAAYRIPAIRRKLDAVRTSNSDKTVASKLNVASGGYGLLIIANAVLYIVVVGGGWLVVSGAATMTTFVTYFCVMMALTSMLIVMLSWHTGFLRAYAIGALVSGSCVLIFTLWVADSWFYRDADYLPAIFFAAILINGLLCAGYVVLLERFRSERETEEVANPTMVSAEAKQTSVG